MVAFLAALPAIFAAISSATELFDVGKKVVEEVSGTPSKAVEIEDLKTEVYAMSDEKIAIFSDRMKSEINEYKAITERVEIQGGHINSETLNIIPEEKRGKIAFMRMTTRPWAVRWMVYAIVVPPLFTVIGNLFIAFLNVFSLAYAEAPIKIDYISISEVLNDLYLSMVGWASGVIMTYMGMREIGKGIGNTDSVSVSDITGSIGGLMSNIKNVFK